MSNYAAFGHGPAVGDRPASGVERAALRWAEIAGLVDISPDGSWTPTARAIEYIKRQGGDRLH
jgi:hypothetical protein